VVKASVSAMDNNVYLVRCVSTGEQLLVDAADDAPRILSLLGGHPGPGQVLTTHGHWDHHRALAQVVAETGATTLAGAPDTADLPVRTDVPLRHGDEVRVGRLTGQVIALRGHTPGSVALALQVPGHPVVLFTGDSLFPGGPGRTTSPTDFASLMDDLETRVFAVLEDDTLVLPGHGDNTTLGAERGDLPVWRDRGW
jgi:glyoxylase-like metal-dependent hydrolase (beta-lactamase superfamily II)